MTDRRVNRTKRQIKKALINLLSKKALSRITVSEITELADIGRGTFYTHYQDIYDLYHSLINELAKDLLDIFSRYYSQATKDNNFIPLFQALYSRPFQTISHRSKTYLPCLLVSKTVN